MLENSDNYLKGVTENTYPYRYSTLPLEEPQVPLENFDFTFVLFIPLLLMLCIYSYYLHYKAIKKREQELAASRVEQRKLKIYLKQKEEELSFIKTGKGKVLGHFFESKQKKLKLKKERYNNPNLKAIFDQQTMIVELLSYHTVIVDQLLQIYPDFSATELQHSLFLYLGFSEERTAKKLQLPIVEVRAMRCKLRSKILKTNKSNLKLSVQALVLN